MPIDFDAARQYALNRLASELPPELSYHTLAHTRDEVEPAVIQLGRMEGVSEEDLQLLRTAALFHDLGFIQKADGHEEISINLAKTVLPGFGYTQAQIKTIIRMISATRLPQNPHSLLEKILVDADMFSLGTIDFIHRSRDLQAELAAQGYPTTEVEWLHRQRRLLSMHRYQTASAHRLQDTQKKANLHQLDKLIAALNGRLSPGLQSPPGPSQPRGIR